MQSGRLSLTGTVDFSREYNGVVIADRYRLAVEFPNDYPDTPPEVRELDGKISRDYHTNPNGKLCLGTSVAVHLEFHKEATIAGYMKRLVIPYLYRHSHIQKVGSVPWQDLPHGTKGILKFYQDYFGIEDPRLIANVLAMIVRERYKGHLDCFCGSGKIARRCHGRLVLDLLEVPKQYMINDIASLCGQR